MSIPGLPPLPLCLKNSLSYASEDTANRAPPSEALVPLRKTGKPPKSSRKQHGKVENQLSELRVEIDSLRRMDRSLFQQLWSLYESIQEFKQAQDKMSETNSECSSISYSLDNTLETIHDYKEHIYVNERFHSRIYENQFVRSGSVTDSVSSGKEEESVYEPVYLKPQCHEASTSVERRASSSSISGKLSKKSSNRLSGVLTQTTYESSI